MRSAILVVSLLCSSAWAQGSADDLKRCLADIGGIAWRLPYTPRMSVYSCSSPAASYRPAFNAPKGGRELRLIASLDIAPDDQDMRSEERQEAVQSAALAHFEALFRQHGYKSAGTLVPKSGSPYVSHRFSRADGQSLTWRIDSSNTWIVTVDGAP